VIKFGNIPETILVRDASGNPTRLRHPWNTGAGAFTITPIAKFGATDDAFNVTLTKIPAKICADLVTKTYRHFVEVQVNTAKVSNVADITTKCGTSGEVSVSFIQR